jgi:replicative DNA helicase
LILCRKNRNGPVGHCWFRFQGEFFRFQELEKDAWPGADGK